MYTWTYIWILWTPRVCLKLDTTSEVERVNFFLVCPNAIIFLVYWSFKCPNGFPNLFKNTSLFYILKRHFKHTFHILVLFRFQAHDVFIVKYIILQRQIHFLYQDWNWQRFSKVGLSLTQSAEEQVYLFLVLTEKNIKIMTFFGINIFFSKYVLFHSYIVILCQQSLRN